MSVMASIMVYCQASIYLLRSVSPLLLCTTREVVTLWSVIDLFDLLTSRERLTDKSVNRVTETEILQKGKQRSKKTYPIY